MLHNVAQNVRRMLCSNKTATGDDSSKRSSKPVRGRLNYTFDSTQHESTVHTHSLIHTIHTIVGALTNFKLERESWWLSWYRYFSTATDRFTLKVFHTVTIHPRCTAMVATAAAHATSTERERHTRTHTITTCGLEASARLFLTYRRTSGTTQRRHSLPQRMRTVCRHSRIFLWDSVVMTACAIATVFSLPLSNS